ncbi:MFS transporter [Rothia koreensis]|uniref:MFS transporter n=1 Tax=Rothia koreensis TaxID=592378 RepID=UPI003F1F250D
MRQPSTDRPEDRAGYNSDRSHATKPTLSGVHTADPTGSSGDRTTAPRTYRQVLKSWQLRIFLISWVGYAAYYFPRNAFSAAKVGVLDDGDMSREALGVLDSAYLAAYAVGQFIWGTVAERWGARIVIAGGMVLATVASAGMGLVPALWLFVPLMIAQGLAQSTGWAAFSKNIASFFGTRVRGRAMGLFASSYAFGGLVAVPVMGWFAYSVFDSWRWAFFVGSAVMVAALAGFLLMQRNAPCDVGLPDVDDPEAFWDEPYDADQFHGERKAKPRGRGQRGVSRDGFRPSDLLAAVRHDPMVLRLGIVYFLLKPARYAVLLWGPVLVTDAIPELDGVTAVMAPVAFGIAGVTAPIVTGWLSDTLFGARRVPPTVISLLVLVVALLAWRPFASTGSVILVAVLLGVVGLTAYGADGMVSGVAAVDFGSSRHAAGATGFINGCGSVGAILGGLLPGFFGASTVFTIFAVTAGAAAALLIRCWNTRPTSS